jgi:type VI secretion system protein ImpC
MGMILRDQGFQALETLWRSVVFLLSRIQVGTKLRVYLMDVSKAELESDLLRADEPEDWSLTRPILAPLSEHDEAIQWAALVGAYDFGGRLDDTLVLQRVGLLAEAGDVPWISAGHSALLGCRSWVDAPNPESWSDPVDPLWTELRGNPEAAWIGLAMPGFLLRDAYGSEGEDTRAFRFKGSGREPGDRLWGNPAFLCGVALGRAFNESGWSLRLRGRRRIEGIPLPAPTEEEMLPVVHGFSHSVAERVMAEGMIPVVAARGEAGVFLPRIGSIASGGGPLKAWWNPSG